MNKGEIDFAPLSELLGWAAGDLAKKDPTALLIWIFHQKAIVQMMCDALQQRGVARKAYSATYSLLHIIEKARIPIDEYNDHQRDDPAQVLQEFQSMLEDALPVETKAQQELDEIGVKIVHTNNNTEVQFTADSVSQN
ncbi:hypothetical protein GF342_02330 [Candidatus Woesearchaeota archaeon]|nr:hypothetical protein [Candidatus Woesearchaeota archaeon]